MKQQKLHEHRDYLQNPRRSTERDPNYRDDLSEFDESRTKQADAESADINVIMKRYETTGQLPQMIDREPMYGDFSDVGSYQEAVNIVQFANEQFMALDAKVRARFSNDPAEFLAFVNNPANNAELVKMGLAQYKPESPDKVLQDIRDNTKAQPKAEPKKDT